MKRFAIALGASAMALVGITPPAIAAKPVNAPVPKRIAQESSGLKTAIFAGGCFWGVEGVFSHVKGVKSAVVGYHGGAAGTAKYSRINAGGTQHAESVRITYDPKVIRYDELLRIFFSVVTDPTQKNRQGPDVGSHYRSALVPLNTEQRNVAKAYLAQMRQSGVWRRPIVTRIEGYRKFYRAEGYHQDYMMKHPGSRYIIRWDKPKIAALKRMFPADYRPRFLRDG